MDCKDVSSTADGDRLIKHPCERRAEEDRVTLLEKKVAYLEQAVIDLRRGTGGRS